jgi:hypothetical protein
MDALRLIKTTRHALAEARDTADVLTEVWQACTLTEAVGSRLALHGEEPLRAVGQLLAEAGGHAGGCLDRPSDDWTGFGRADRLTELNDPGTALRELRRLIHEMAEALVVLACGADAEHVYWRCIDAVDAAAECQEAVAELLRALPAEAPQSLPEAEPGAEPGRQPVGEQEEDRAAVIPVQLRRRGAEPRAG